MEYLIHFHSILRWFLLFGMVYVVFNSWIRYRSTIILSKFDRISYVLTMILFHVQFLVGGLLYFLSEKVVFLPDTMKIPALRFYSVEHVLGMLIALIFITMGKKKADRSILPYKQLAIYYTISLVISLLSIPWPFRNLGAAWW